MSLLKIESASVDPAECDRVLSLFRSFSLSVCPPVWVTLLGAPLYLSTARPAGHPPQWIRRVRSTSRPHSVYGTAAASRNLPISGFYAHTHATGRISARWTRPPGDEQPRPRWWVGVLGVDL